jgi:hypothetical protein
MATRSKNKTKQRIKAISLSIPDFKLSRLNYLKLCFIVHLKLPIFSAVWFDLPCYGEELDKSDYINIEELDYFDQTFVSDDPIQIKTLLKEVIYDSWC